MNTQKNKDKAEDTKSNAFGFGRMGHGMSEMMTKCCTDGGGFPDCVKMMEEMKKHCCAPLKNEAASEKEKG